MVDPNYFEESHLKNSQANSPRINDHAAVRGVSESLKSLVEIAPLLHAQKS